VAGLAHAGSGAYRIVPATYRPLEVLDLEIFDGHFMGGRTTRTGAQGRHAADC